VTSSPVFDKARETAVAYIGIDRFKSSGKVRDNLRKKGVDGKTADQVIEYLRSIDYIDDRRAAQRVARRYTGRSLRSKRAMFQVFLRNGIPSDIARDEAEALVDDRDTGLQLCRASFAVPDREQEPLMMKLLTRRGYAPDISRAIVRRFVASAEENTEDA